MSLFQQFLNENYANKIEDSKRNKKVFCKDQILKSSSINSLYHPSVYFEYDKNIDEIPRTEKNAENESSAKCPGKELENIWCRHDQIKPSTNANRR